MSQETTKDVKNSSEESVKNSSNNVPVNKLVMSDEKSNNKVINNQNNQNIGFVDASKERKYEEPELVVDEFLLKNKNIDVQKSIMRKNLSMASSKQVEEKLNFYRRIKLKLYKAGIEKEPEQYVKKIMIIAAVITLVITLGLGIWALTKDFMILGVLVVLCMFLILGFFVIHYLSLLISFAFLNYKAFSRTKEVEKVLPEFLRLVATNYRSGLPLDKALTASNRKRFGILSREIEQVAKTTKVKGDLAKALEIFGKKFDSKILERAMNSISISIKSGSNISVLLDEIANNITKMRNMQASMAANVKNYVIFIVVAGIVVAPLMFAMSYQMNHTIADVKDKLESQTDSASMASSPISVSDGGGVNPNNFDIFAVLMILTNCVISSMIISMIRQGNFQQGFKNVFIYLVISISLYFLGKIILAGIINVV